MKRHFFTAALAIVALSVAVANTVNSSRFDIPSGPLNSTLTSDPACGSNSVHCTLSGTFPCTINGEKQYGPDDLGICTIELFHSDL